ncbi:hypothetical protein HanPSC8_Chr03g0117701 [Helianthus annuus]|nr:hypothetical protein HanIR_Chr03g0132101 [Helianthus annuus]KAJ0944517.1 hypothetical protein HanPSC8_Chr03g0117701 [Helianthus annuus]
MRYQRIQEKFTSLANHSNCITTDTSDLLIRSMCLSILCFICFRVFGGVKFLCWEWCYLSRQVGC